jgi:serpin B
MAIAMLGEITEGEKRDEIMNALGVGDIEQLRTLTKAICESVYCDNGATTQMLSNSMWLDDNVDKVNKTAVDALAEYYYASSYQGDMSDEEFRALCSKWISEGTGGLFNSCPISADTVLTLISTLYIESLWGKDNSFNFSLTYTADFYTDTKTVQAKYMKREQKTYLYAGEGFYMIKIPLETGGYMWFFLPTEDWSVDKIISGDYLMDVLSGEIELQRREYYMTLSIPKFNVSQEGNITDLLQALGISRTFSAADLSTLGESAVATLEMLHGASLEIKESGIKGGAYANLGIEYGEPAFPSGDRLEFIFDRPFVFAVTTAAKLPLFVGSVNDPTK